MLWKVRAIGPNQLKLFHFSVFCLHRGWFLSKDKLHTLFSKYCKLKVYMYAYISLEKRYKVSLVNVFSTMWFIFVKHFCFLHSLKNVMFSRLSQVFLSATKKTWIEPNLKYCDRRKVRMCQENWGSIVWNKQLDR